jgi:hypothetical protein
LEASVDSPGFLDEINCVAARILGPSSPRGCTPGVFLVRWVYHLYHLSVCRFAFFQITHRYPTGHLASMMREIFPFSYSLMLASLRACLGSRPQPQGGDSSAKRTRLNTRNTVHGKRLCAISTKLCSTLPVFYKRPRNLRAMLRSFDIFPLPPVDRVLIMRDYRFSPVFFKVDISTPPYAKSFRVEVALVAPCRRPFA